MGGTLGGENAQADSHISKEDGLRYWNSIDADDNGMLGGVPSVEGFGNISRIDLQGSRTFLARLGIGMKRGRREVENVLEGGAGVGRITKGLLLGVAKEVDVIEPVAKFTAALNETEGVRHVFTMGLEDWQPAAGATYGLIWIQWCAGHLTDEQLVEFLSRCASSLTESGYIIVKENLTQGDADAFDELDSSVTRGDAKFRSIFEQAGLRVIRSELQRGIPTTSALTLLPLRMYALRP